MRMDKFLSQSGFGSRKEVKSVLKKENVLVNGKPVKEGKFQLDEVKDVVTVNDETIVYQQYYYYMLNKPKGVISATEDGYHRTVLDILAKEDYRGDIFPVGRLDKDTTGLLLLTNDGVLSHELLSPKKHVPKTYWAKVAGIVTEKDQKIMAEGMVLSDGESCKPGKLEILSVDEIYQHSFILLTITEGKYHQVKRMFESVGKEVLDLHRQTMGSLTLDEQLSKGHYRSLTQTEINQLKYDDKKELV